MQVLWEPLEQLTITQPSTGDHMRPKIAGNTTSTPLNNNQDFINRLMQPFPVKGWY